ncbi:hypothetical protein O982_24935 [Mycobacterium avium 10-5581]|nr:hypothetical protein O982_24935 [Mycobacterium avium 10-5581]
MLSRFAGCQEFGEQLTGVGQDRVALLDEAFHGLQHNTHVGVLGWWGGW